MSVSEYVVGIDLGGTNVRAALVNRIGEILAWADTPIHAAQGPKAGVERICILVQQVMKIAGCKRIDGIGFGCTGPIDQLHGTIQNPYTLTGWENVDIRTPLSEVFDAPLVLENDADAAALGEAWLGSGRGSTRFTLMTVGTGIGAGFILDGNIYRGLDGAHPEAGHMILDPQGPECYCGARGCLESLASGTAIARFATQAVRDHPTSLLNKKPSAGKQIDAIQVVHSARQGDPLAQLIVRRAATYLGLGLVNLTLAYLPEIIALGGGVMKNIDLFLPEIQKILTRHNVIVPTNRVRIVSTALDEKAGVLGAARAILQEIT